MKQITAYIPETPEEIAYIDNYVSVISLQKQTIEQLTAEIAALKTPIPVPSNVLYEADFTTLKITNGNLTGWDKAKLPFVEGIYFNNSGRPAYSFQDIRLDAGIGRQVMYAQIIDDDPTTSGTSRAQMTVDHNQALDQVHTSHMMYLHPDIASLASYPGTIRWFTLFEMWNLRDATQGGDPAGSSRISISLFKDATGPLYWHVAYEEMQPVEKVIWQQTSTAPIPFGNWFNFDILVKRGGTTTGKVKLLIDGVPVFDISNNTIYRNKPELYINQWQMFKLYASDQIMDWARTNGKKLAVMYDNLKWYKF